MEYRGVQAQLREVSPKSPYEVVVALNHRPCSGTISTASTSSPVR
jgi:hypothetical protein